MLPQQWHRCLSAQAVQGYVRTDVLQIDAMRAWCVTFPWNCTCGFAFVVPDTYWIVRSAVVVCAKSLCCCAGLGF